MRLSAPSLFECSRIGHGFFGRKGGVSPEPFASLNVSLRNDDRRAHVLENRRRIADAIGGAPENIVIARQVHGTRCLAIDTPWPPDQPAEADALVTTKPGIILGTTTADCAPVLLVDPRAGVIGAAHAGWRGALDGIIESVVGDMTRLGAVPAQTVAAVGPCIAEASYEIGPEFEQQFVDVDRANRRFFSNQASGSRHFDLRGFCRARLDRLGVATIDILPNDTYAEQDAFFSYRRTCKRGEKSFGLQLAAIMLRA